MCYLFWVSGLLSAQTLHFIFFGDTDDERNGKEVMLSYNYFKNDFLTEIRENTSLKIKSYFYIGSDFTLDNIKYVIPSLSTDDNDAIFFFYNGHGRNNEKNDFPSLAFNGGSKTLLSIYNKLRSKPHRLLVAMASACNKLPQSSSSTIGDGRGAMDGNIRIYRSLFQTATGDYMLSSSKKDEYSWTIKNRGTILRLAFEDVLYTNESNSLSWPAFLDLVSGRCSEIAAEHNISQHPQWISGDYHDGAARVYKDIYLRVKGNSSLVTSHWGSEAGSELYSIDTNAKSCTISSLPEWCKVTQKSLKRFVVEYEENTGDERTGCFYVKATGSNKTVKIEVRQDAGKKIPSAEIDRVWLEQHVKRQYGYFVYDCLVIHVNFVVHHLLNEKVTCIAYFYFENGEKLKDFNGQYRTTDGQVSTGDITTSHYEDSRWNDFTLVIPYSELHVIPNMYNPSSLKCCVEVFGPDGESLAQSNYVSFTY